MTLERCRRILCCGVREENGRWPRRFQALLKDATTTGRLQRLLPGATSASRFGGAFEEGARVADWAQGLRFASDDFEQGRGRLFCAFLKVDDHCSACRSGSDR